MYRHIRVDKVKFTNAWAIINRHGSWFRVMMIGSEGQAISSRIMMEG